MDAKELARLVVLLVGALKDAGVLSSSGPIMKEVDALTQLYVERVRAHYPNVTPPYHPDTPRGAALLERAANQETNDAR